MAEQVAELKNRLSTQAFQLDQELKTYIDNRYFGPEFHRKNREMDQVKSQLRQIEMDKDKTAVPQALAIDPLSIEKITDESGDETAEEEITDEASEETAEWSKEDNEADLSAIAMVNPVEKEEEEIRSERDEPLASVNPPQMGSSEVKTSNKWFTFDDIPPSRYKKRKDLEKHYKRMAVKYYLLGGNNNPPLKQVFTASLPNEFQPKLQQMMMTLRKEVATTTIGEIYQLALAALDKLCEQQQIFKWLNQDSSKLERACNKSYLNIKCKELGMCECKPKKKMHWQPQSRTFQQKAFRRGRRKQRYHYFKKKKTHTKSNKCFICGK
ncbi:polyprotein [Arachis hypogaea]|nr:polyprotein [Arachis hypogaea]